MMSVLKSVICQHRWRYLEKANQQRLQEKASVSGFNETPGKNRPSSQSKLKLAKESNLTLMDTPNFNIQTLNSAKFVEKEFLSSEPAKIGNCAGRNISELENHAASSLVVLKSGRTPPSDKNSAVEDEVFSVKYTYPPPSISKESTIAPHAPNAEAPITDAINGEQGETRSGSNVCFSPPDAKVTEKSVRRSSRLQQVEMTVKESGPSNSGESAIFPCCSLAKPSGAERGKEEKEERVFSLTLTFR